MPDAAYADLATCPQCGRTGPPEDFPRDSAQRKNNGRSYICRLCKRERDSARPNRNSYQPRTCQHCDGLYTPKFYRSKYCGPICVHLGKGGAASCPIPAKLGVTYWYVCGGCAHLHERSRPAALPPAGQHAARRAGRDSR